MLHRVLTGYDHHSRKDFLIGKRKTSVSIHFFIAVSHTVWNSEISKLRKTLFPKNGVTLTGQTNTD